VVLCCNCLNLNEVFATKLEAAPRYQLHFQVVMTMENGESLREPFSLRNATHEAIDKYIANLSKTAVDAVKGDTVKS